MRIAYSHACQLTRKLWFQLAPFSLTNHQTSTLSVTVNGPGTLSFYCSSIADSGGRFDYEFDIDGTYEDDIYDDTSCYQEVDPSTGNP